MYIRMLSSSASILIVVRFVTRLENKLSRYRRFGATRRGGEQNRKIVEPDDKLTLIAGDSVVGGPLQSDSGEKLLFCDFVISRV